MIGIKKEGIMRIIGILILLGLIAWGWWAWNNYPPFHDYVKPYVEKFQKTVQQTQPAKPDVKA